MKKASKTALQNRAPPRPVYLPRVASAARGTLAPDTPAVRAHTNAHQNDWGSMTQGDLLSWRETSREAARSIRPLAAGYRADVLAAIRAAGADGLTDDECQRALAMNPSTQRPRRLELEAARLVTDSGRTRLTASGRKAVVWIASEGCR